MNVKNLSTLLLSSLLLSGCSIFSFGPEVEPIEVQSVAVEKTPLNIDHPSPVTPRRLMWYVITPENYQEIFDKLEKNNTSVVLYGLTDDGYEDLSENLSKLRSYIIQQRNIIDSYKEYYEPPNINTNE